MKIYDTQLWCVDVKMDDLGLPCDEWMDLSIDFNHIIAIKKSGWHQFTGEGKAVLYTPGGEHFIVNMSFEEAVSFWKS